MKNLKFTLLLGLMLGSFAFFTSCEKTPDDVLVTDIEINPSTMNLFFEGSTQLDYDVLPAEATNKKISWKSSNDEVVSVDDEGKITAYKKLGTATITASATDASKVEGKVVVTVISDLLGFTISTSEILKMTQTADLVLSYDPAGYIPVGTPTFKSLDTDIATVSGDEITGITIGEARIEGTVDGVKDTTVISVITNRILVESFDIKCSEANDSLLVGKELLVGLENVLPIDHELDGTPEFTSDDTNIKITPLDIIEDGYYAKIEGLSDGKATIKCTIDGVEEDIEITTFTPALEYTFTIAQGAAECGMGTTLYLMI